MKIGILSDTHLGVFPTDAELGGDPFEAFEEGLKILVKNGADLILHAGDFYDRTDPPPWVQDRATRILRSTITGEAPNLEVIEGTVNFEAEDVSIAVPVFLIHGTHDRPIGRPIPAPAFQHLVAAGYINYIDIDSENRFASRQVVLRKNGVTVLLTGAGHRPEGFINASIAKCGVPSSDKCISFACVHNCVEGIVPTSGEYLDLSHFERINWVIVGHAHGSRAPKVRKRGAPDRPSFETRIFVPGATTVARIEPQEEGGKYVHLLQISKKKQTALKSFKLSRARPVYHRTVTCDNLTAKQARNKVAQVLAALPLERLDKKALVRIYVTGELSSRSKRTDLHFEELAAQYRDKILNWSEMILASDLYTEDDLKRLDELWGAMESGSAFSAPFERFCEKLGRMGFQGKYFKAEELYQTLSEVATPQAAKRRVEKKLDEVLGLEHT